MISVQSPELKVRVFPLIEYVQKALERAEYNSDENGIIIGKVPEAQDFFAQGNSQEEAEENLRDVIEGNLLLALQLGLEIPALKGIEIQYLETDSYKL